MKKCYSCGDSPAPYMLDNKPTCISCMSEAVRVWFDQQDNETRRVYRRRLEAAIRKSPPVMREMLTQAIVRGIIKFN